LNVSGTLGVVAEGLAELLDGEVEAAVKIAVRFVGPKCLFDFFAGDDSVGVGREEHEEVQRLWGEIDGQSISPELAALGVEFKQVELDRGFAD
jgi:hypothetical protein